MSLWEEYSPVNWGLKGLWGPIIPVSGLPIPPCVEVDSGGLIAFRDGNRRRYLLDNLTTAQRVWFFRRAAEAFSGMPDADRKIAAWELWAYQAWRAW